MAIPQPHLSGAVVNSDQTNLANVPSSKPQSQPVGTAEPSSDKVPVATQSAADENNKGNFFLSLCNPIPILDPNASSIKGASTSIFSESPSKNNLDEFSFGPALQVKNSEMEEMFELPNKRKASISPQSIEKSKKERKAAKKEQKSREKVKQKSKLQLEVSPSQI